MYEVNLKIFELIACIDWLWLIVYQGRIQSFGRCRRIDYYRQTEISPKNRTRLLQELNEAVRYDDVVANKALHAK
jgi:hypothetical protein